MTLEEQIGQLKMALMNIEQVCKRSPVIVYTEFTDEGIRQSIEDFKPNPRTAHYQKQLWGRIGDQWIKLDEILEPYDETKECTPI